jgi:hypothetical protein
MLPFSASCWALICCLIASFSCLVRRRPASACCSATDAPVICTTTLTRWLLTPSGMVTGVTDSGC